MAAADLPSCFDRADGQNGRPGTPTANSSILIQASNGAQIMDNIPLEEFPDSPEIERAEQATITKRFRCGWVNGLTLITGLGRGTVQMDSQENWTRILSSKVQFVKPGSCVLTIVSEGLSFDLPPDRFSITPVELGINIMKNPRYFYALEGTLPSSGPTDYLLNQMVIRNLQNYFENTSPQLRDSIMQLLYYSLNNEGTVSGGVVTNPQITLPGASGPTAGIAGTQMAKAAAMEILQKYWRNEETPSIVGYEMRWSTFNRFPQYLNPGGYIENPITQANPGLPDYFWDASFSQDGSASIFDRLVDYNPQSYSSDGTPTGQLNLSCLRKADSYEWDRTFFRKDATWWITASGFWDPQFYSGGNRPAAYTDYLFATPSTTTQ